MTTAGDHNQTTPLHALATNTPGGKSLWTHELEARLLAGELDCIVHSLKDVPTTLVPGCMVRTVGPREESRDCVVMRAGRPGSARSLADLPAGSVLGTSSVRRAAMIRRRWPGLVIADVRGNVGTRLAKLDDATRGYDALVLAGAGMQRLGLGHRASSWLSGSDGVLPAVGQGVLGVEFRDGDAWVRGLVDGVEEKRVGWACVAERKLLGELEGGCSVPVGVETEWDEEKEEEEGDEEEESKQHKHKHKHEDSSNRPMDNNDNSSSTTPNTEQSKPSSPSAGFTNKTTQSTSDTPGTLLLHALIVSPDGRDAVAASRREHVSCDADAERCGRELASELVRKGARRILEDIYREREREREKGGGEEEEGEEGGREGGIEIRRD
jgi:hydroxymethylbilane synthase